jgi:phosphoribosylanthranilate isomerase
MTSLEDAQAAVNSGADSVGFNFFPGSRRYLTPAAASAISAQLPSSVLRVGIFVNHSRREIEAVLREVPLDALQFHGEEPDELLAGWSKFKTIRAVQVFAADFQTRLGRAAELADYMLIDSGTKDNRGGTGRAFAPELLREVSGEILRTKVIIAGGLSEKNVGEIIVKLSPFGVDCASGVESAPGKKIAKLMQAFVNSVRSAE